MNQQPVVLSNNDDSSSGASVPTKIIPLLDNGTTTIASPQATTTTTTTTTTTSPSSASQQQQQQPVVTIALDADEERLFHTLVETANAYERGELTLPPPAPLDDNTTTTTTTTTTTNNVQSPQQQQQPVVNKNNNKHIEIRVAGGWVRDKLLGLNSHDVDVAVDCLSGKDFATLVTSYLQSKPDLVGKMGVIAANPHQSKHLETATMMVHHVDVDFTNLRAEEVYESHSRIPNATTIRFGTPLEDAMRRDFTINALFFNLNTRHVEDWTRRGLHDLMYSQRLVTPLDPHQTFRDDPLRVLRAIRFAVRYGFELDHVLQQAVMCHEVHRALHVKVSRERVGKELEGMLSGRGAQPIKALYMLTKLKLAGAIFTIPTDHHHHADVLHHHHHHTKSIIYGTLMGDVYEGPVDVLSHFRELAWEEARTLITLLPPVLEAHNNNRKEAAVLVVDDNDDDKLKKLKDDDTTTTNNNNSAESTQVDTRLLYLAVFLLPWRHLHYHDHKGKVQTVISYMIRDGIKFKNKDVIALTTLMEKVEQMNDFLTKAAMTTTTSNSSSGGGVVAGHNNSNTTITTMCRLDAGMLLRTTKNLWVTLLLLATVAKLREADKAAAVLSSAEGAAAKQPTTPTPTTTAATITMTREQVLHHSQAIYNTIIQMGLDNCWDMKPLMDGRAVIETMDVPKGPIVKSYLDEQVRWMLLNPNGSREDCITHLRQYKRVLETQHEEQNERIVGISDGGETSSPRTNKHLSKKMHVESMDLV